MFQKIIGIMMLIFSVFMIVVSETRNPEFLWVLLILGVVFILMPINIFEK